MDIKITKMHGIGNSYILIEDLDRKLEPKYPKIAKFISDKNFGVGSDGILVLNKGKIAKYWMRVFNPDGSEAEMCGNGIRMFARYLYDKKLVGREMQIEVGGSHGGKIVKPKINSDNSVTVDIGKGEILGKKTLQVAGMKISGIQVSVGNPHFVVFEKSESDATENVNNYGAAIEDHKVFQPSRISAEFVFIKDSKNIVVHVWERGAGPTLACGTGACASAFAAYNENKVGDKVVAKLPGGNLDVKIEKDGTIFMTGPAEYIFSGSMDLDENLE